jgi:hypothetical protein
MSSLANVNIVAELVDLWVNPEFGMVFVMVPGDIIIQNVLVAMGPDI